MKKYQGLFELVLNVNGETRSAPAHPQDTLLHFLREKLGLTGAKCGCENGDCGACTVLIDGVPVKSCLALAVECEGHTLTTIEGLHDHPVQRAFVSENGFQCGFCTPGQILNAASLLRFHTQPSNETVREWMESNLCRCTGYEGIARAIARASGESVDGGQEA